MYLDKPTVNIIILFDIVGEHWYAVCTY